MAKTYAQPANAVAVSVYAHGLEKFLTVDLHGEHWEMYQQYRQLPGVLKYKGELYKKTGWNSDSCHAWFKQLDEVAFFYMK